jgi:hypothetical protein
VHFAQGVTFTFAAGTELASGETVLVVSNPAAMAFRYDAGLPIAGQFTGDLSDDGETISLLDAADRVIQEFTYDDEGDWPDEADGGGKTLVVDNVRGDYDDPANWLASDEPGGTPGTGTGVTGAVDYLMAQLVTGPEHGSLTLHDDGSFEYTPDEGYVGPDSFTYVASDGDADSNEATVTIEVNPSGP